MATRCIRGVPDNVIFDTSGTWSGRGLLPYSANCNFQCSRVQLSGSHCDGQLRGELCSWPALDISSSIWWPSLLKQHHFSSSANVAGAGQRRRRRRPSDATSPPFIALPASLPIHCTPLRSSIDCASQFLATLRQYYSERLSTLAVLSFLFKNSTFGTAAL